MTQNDEDGAAASARQITEECDAIKALLLKKNAAYGDSALNPIRCFSKSDSVETINVRLDDKLSRIMRGSAAGEDVVLDLIGYLVLLRIATKRQQQSTHRSRGLAETFSAASLLAVGKDG